MIPPEYAAELERIQKQRMLAQLLQQRSMGFQGAGQGSGRIMPKTSPLAWMANMGTGYLANQAEAAGAGKASDVRNRMMQDENAEVEGLLNTPQEDQYRVGQLGKFDRTRKLAEALLKRNDERVGKFADVTKDMDPAVAGTAVLQGRLPGGAAYNPPPIKPSEFGTAPGGGTYVRDYNRKGETNTKFEPKGTVVNNNMPKQENQFSLGLIDTELKARQVGAESAKNVYTATARAADALERGAKAGGGEQIKQILRKSLQAFGVTPTATAQTEELSMALGTAILSEASKIKPISNTDIATLRDIVGSINTDPSALSRALAFSQALALKGLSDYSSYIDEQSSSLTDPLARQRLTGSKIGFEMPKALTGPQAFQLEVLRNYQMGGGDISRFGEPGTGLPFPPGARIQVNPTAGMPGVNPPAKTNPPGWEKLTPAEQAEYQRLKARLGQ